MVTTAPPQSEVKTVTQHIAFIVDGSESMSTIQGAVIEGFNTTIDTINANKQSDQKVKITRTDFNHNVNVRFVKKGVGKLERMSTQNYIPTGMTAMYDAVGVTIEELERVVKSDEPVLVKIFSDGMENSSHKWTAQRLGAKIQELQDKQGWTFEYIGANQDLSKVSDQLHIPKGNIVNYASTPVGTQYVNTVSSGATMDWMNSSLHEVKLRGSASSSGSLYSMSNEVTDVSGSFGLPITSGPVTKTTVVKEDDDENS